MFKFDTLYFKILNEEKKIKMIYVEDSEGKTINTYAPNNIGRTKQQLLDKAEKEAAKIGGKVHVTYWDK